MKKVISYLKHNIVFALSIFISIVVIVYGYLNSIGLDNISVFLLDVLDNNFSWLYIISLPLFLGFLMYLSFSKYGSIKIGGENCKPDYETRTWIAMLFCAATGIGLLFWSIAEPLTHYVNPQYNIAPCTKEALEFSMRTCYLHWGFLPWSCYAIVGLCMAYLFYNHSMPFVISSTFNCVFRKNNKLVSTIVDVLALIVSVAGVATSLGLGCMQICGGLEYLFGVPNDNIAWFVLIAIITSIFMFSAISGVNKGIKTLSNINFSIAIIFLVFAFILGPKSATLNNLLNSLGQHIFYFISDSLSINVFDNNIWIFSWRVFYWAWWIAWAPFTGLFFARISKGRTIKEFILCTVIVPSICTFLWQTVFGTIALNVAGNWDIKQLVEIISHPETAVFIVFNEYPLGKVLSLGMIVLLLIFFITSADSATFSLCMMSSDGIENPTTFKKIVWSLVQAATAYILLCSGGLKALQTISIVAAFPFLIIMLFMCICINKILSNDFTKKNKGEKYGE